MKLELRALHKNFGEHVIFDNVNLTVDKVNTLVFLGPSGGGKTTLLRMIAGLDNPTSGNIYINDKNIPYDSGLPPDMNKKLREYRKTVGMVFQMYNLFPHLNALQNITFPIRKVHKYSEEKALDTAHGLLKRFSLEEHAHKRPSQLSGGQKQRIAISRAIAISPQILLLDEPTSALDPEFTSEVLDMVIELRKVTDIIVVTHHMGFAQHASDYILFVDDKKIVEHGPSEQLFNNSKNPTVKSFFDKILRH